MRVILVVEVQFVSVQKPYVAAVVMDLLRDKGPEICEVAASSGSVLPDYIWKY